MDVKSVQTQNHLHSFEAPLIGAFVLTILFVLCWATAAYGGVAVPGAFVSLFTTNPVRSLSALHQGVLWAAAFGAIAGALIALGDRVVVRRTR
jgi:hypothetical protein